MHFCSGDSYTLNNPAHGHPAHLTHNINEQEETNTGKVHPSAHLEPLQACQQRSKAQSAHTAGAHP